MATQDPNLTEIVNELVSRKCHTIILYGSRARGEETSASDYDILGVRKSGRVTRDARPWKGTYLDIFIYPESKLKHATHKQVYMRDGIVLREKDKLGTRFLKDLNAIYKKGPKKLSSEEIQVQNVWVEKCLKRIQKGGVEGNLRRMELIPSMLEHYFLVRGMWFEGSKKSLGWLKKNDPKVYAAFEATLKPSASVESLAELVRSMHFPHP